MNERRRVKRELTIAPLRQAVNEGSAALNKAMKEKSDDAPAGEIDRMYNEFNELLNGRWYPAWIRWGLYSIEGFEIDEVPATVDTLCEQGPSDLVQEVFHAILAEAGISTVQEKNSTSDGTSDVAVDGKEKGSTVPSADQPDGGKTATAPSSTQGT
jgi:hypothetical protein